MPTRNRILTWLWGSAAILLLLMAAAMLIVPRLIDFASVKQKIRTAVTERTGGKIDYQGIGLSYFPRLSVELRQATLVIPELAEARVAALRISPEFFPLLIGELRLARIELDTPQLSLQFPYTKLKDPTARPSTLTDMAKSLAVAVAPVGQSIRGLELQVDNGQLTVARSTQKLVEIEGLSLQSERSLANPHSVEASLQAKCAELKIYRNGHPETAKDISLSSNVEMAGGRLTVKFDRLSLAEPALALTGDLSLAPTTPAIALNLSGTDINVDATRKTALALAGDITPIKQIFDYLRGGQVPQISLTSHGGTLSELADLKNILIKGKLQDGEVSVPGISLDLTGVFGDVVIDKGVLQGTGLTASLGASTGRDGSLKIGLTRGNDLFELDLMLSADLAETRSILHRLIKAPAFTAELEKIANLRGTGQGKLTLGDSLHDIEARIEVSDLKLSADYQRVPLPIKVEQGRFTFGKRRLDIAQFSGSLGKSRFADISGRLLWENDPSIEISSGRLDSDMAELYPWLASLEGLRDTLQELKKVTGRLALSTLFLKAEAARPSALQFASTGTLQDLSIETEAFPDSINVASGGFIVDRQQLSFAELRASGQDAALTLSGSIKGFPRRLEQIELSLDGYMGPESLEWLSDRLKVPESYAIRGPLSISQARIFWQPDSMASFNGLVTLAKGPAITADVDYGLEQLQVNRLHIKDQYSDAEIILGLDKEQHDFKYVGKLRYETLQNIFVGSQFGSGRLEGDFSVTVPQSGQAEVTTTGHLTGEQLPIPLSPDDKANIEQIKLEADGSQVAFQITKFTRKNHTWEPVEGTVTFDRHRTEIRLAGAKLCGINSPGRFSFSGDELSLDFDFDGKGLDVATSYTCLTEGRFRATGSLDFSSKLTAKGKMDELVKNLKGPLQLTLSNGVIKQDKWVSRTLEVLNVTEIVKGRLPDLRTKGFAYTTMSLQGEFKNGKLIIHKLFMDGETLELVGSGEIHLEDKTLEVQLLAAPLKTIDTVVKYIPGVNYLLGGSLVAIPVSITGTLDDPQVRVMSASAVSSSLYNLAKRTIASPFKLFEQINPWNNE